MNRVQYMELAISTFMGAKRVSAQHTQAHHMATKLGIKLDEAGLLTRPAPEGSNEVVSLPEHADFVVKTAINVMCSDTGDFNMEGSALDKAIKALEYYLNPKAAEAVQKNANGMPTSTLDNPNNLPVYMPGGQLAISGIPTMPSWPSGSSAPTQGMIGDAAITQVR